MGEKTTINGEKTLFTAIRSFRFVKKNMDREKVRLLEQRLIEFAVTIIRIAEQLPSNPAAKHIQGQMIRSGTAPAMIYAEAQSAESRADFVHKMKRGLKELRETAVDLIMIQKMQWLAEAETTAALKEADQLISIFVASVKTASGK
jgi:four helix bundle protein